MGSFLGPGIENNFFVLRGKRQFCPLSDIRDKTFGSLSVPLSEVHNECPLTASLTKFSVIDERADRAMFSYRETCGGDTQKKERLGRDRYKTMSWETCRNPMTE